VTKYDNQLREESKLFMTNHGQKSQSQKHRQDPLSSQEEDILKQVNTDQRPGANLDVPQPGPELDPNVIEQAGFAPHAEEETGLGGNEETEAPRHPDVKSEKNAARVAGDPRKAGNEQIINPKSNSSNQYR